MSTPTPHDALFKKFFGNIEITKDFLENYLPKEIRNMVDLDTLYLESTSHVDKKLKEIFSDLLFTVNIDGKEGYLYFLFEHKSYISIDISLQILKYMVEIWIKAFKEIKGVKLGKLPVIIPIVIYNGKDRWNIDENLGILIKDYDELSKEIKKHIPNYEYLMYDITGYTDEQIKGAVELQIFIKIAKAVSTNDTELIKKVLIEAAMYYGKLEKASGKAEYFEILLTYVSNTNVDFTKEDLHTVMIEVERVYPEGSDIVSSLAERLREEGRLEGIEKGIEKGERKTLIKNVTTLLTIKFGAIPEDMKEKILKLDTTTLNLILTEIFRYENLDEIKKYLNQDTK